MTHGLLTIRGLLMTKTHGMVQMVLEIAMELPVTTVDLVTEPEQVRIQEEVLVLVTVLCRKSRK